MSAPSAHRPVSPPTEITARPSYSDTSVGIVPPPPDPVPAITPALRALLHSRESVAPLDGHSLPGYRLRREVGRGGMGVVYEADQLDLKRVVAVKLLHPAAPFGPEQSDRFRAEAEAAARLQHPNIVGVHD